MKEILNLIILIFVLCCPSNGRSVKTGNESQSSRLGLKGKVKSLVNRHFYATEESGSVYKGKPFTRKMPIPLFLTLTDMFPKPIMLISMAI
jgi:hypothetical protein